MNAFSWLPAVREDIDFSVFSMKQLMEYFHTLFAAAVLRQTFKDIISLSRVRSLVMEGHLSPLPWSSVYFVSVILHMRYAMWYLLISYYTPLPCSSKPSDRQETLFPRSKVQSSENGEDSKIHSISLRIAPTDGSNNN